MADGNIVVGPGSRTNPTGEYKVVSATEWQNAINNPGSPDPHGEGSYPTRTEAQGKADDLNRPS